MANYGVYWDAPTSRWNTGLRWSSGAPQHSTKKPMATIALNVSKLTIPQKLLKGQDIITKSTNNPSVPGNAAALATMTAAQAAFSAANAAWDAARQRMSLLMTERDAAEAAWLTALNGLAGVTESVTAGDAVKIESAGFDLRADPQPPRPVEQVQDLRVSLTQEPGHSALRWSRQSQAEAYIVQRSFEPLTESSWVQLAVVTESKYEGNGVAPGQKCWYRVAALNKLGQGPWSSPEPRPVL